MCPAYRSFHRLEPDDSELGRCPFDNNEWTLWDGFQTLWKSPKPLWRRVTADRRLLRGCRNRRNSNLRRPRRGASRRKGTAFKPSPATPLPCRCPRPRHRLPGRGHDQTTRRRVRHPPNHRDRPPRPPRYPSPQRTDGMGRRDPQASSRALRHGIVIDRRRPPVRDRRTDRRQPIPERRRPRATPTRLDIAFRLEQGVALSIIERVGCRKPSPGNCLEFRGRASSGRARGG